jgi:galactokinase
MPFAIDLGTVVAAAARPDRTINVYSTNRAEAASFALSNSWGGRQGTWLDYVEGMARSLERSGVLLSGADLLIQSDVPLGAGLSSSAALEVATGLALCGVSQQNLESRGLVDAAHRAETEYVGTQSGIMDQYVSVFGRLDHCLLLDCDSITSEQIPLKLDTTAIVVCDTGVKHELAASEYNQRRTECTQAVNLLRQYLPSIRSLRDVSAKDLSTYADKLPEKILKRCRHVISENERTLAATKALSMGDYFAFGCLMFQSHESLRVDYEVTSPELDLLVDTAQACEGVLGSRMTGGGFGGCTITLVQRDAIEDFMDVSREAYRSKFGSDPEFIVPRPSDGAREVV